MESTVITTGEPLLHRLLQAHPILVFDAAAIANYVSIDPEDTLPLACEALTYASDQLPKLLDLSHITSAAADTLLTELDETDLAEQRLPPFLLGAIAPGADLGRWSLTQVTQAPDGSKHWLRWHDVRVWVNLLWIAKPEQLAYLIGPASSVGWSWQGQWYESKVSTGEKPVRSIRWSTEQWQQIQSIGVINRVFNLTGQPAIGDLHREAMAIATADAQANTMTIWDMASRIEFARHTVLYGKDFWQAEQFHPLMVEVATREATYSEVTSCQDDHFWDEARRIASERDIESKGRTT